MMSAFDDDVNKFGESPTYANWTPNTTITLANVPWTSDYRDIVYFDNNAALNSYLTNGTSSDLTYNKSTVIFPNTPIKLDIPLSKAYKYNYIHVRNNAQNGVWPAAGDNVGTIKDELTDFYYFINDIQYHSPNSVSVNVQLDVWQTFCHVIKMGNCYVDRGHIGIANTNQFRMHGRDFLTVPEGLDCGNEYVIKTSYIKEIASPIMLDRARPPDSDVGVLVLSNVSWSGSGGTIDDPMLKSATGSMYEGLPNGCEIYYFTSIDAWQTALFTLSTMPWITQGIISVSLVPDRLIDHSKLGLDNIYGHEKGDPAFYYFTGGYAPPINELTLKKNWRDDIAPTGRYKNLKKFMTYPYSMVELTAHTGTPIVLKPEAMQDDDFIVVEMAHLAPPAPRIAYYCRGYNKGNVFAQRWSNGQLRYDYSDGLDMLTGITDLPAFSVANDSYMSYMAANRNTIAYQHQSADWSQQRALAANQLSYDQSTAAMGTSNALTNMSNDAANQQTALSNQTLGYRDIVSGANSGINGVASALSGNAGGALSGALGMANAAADYAIGSHQNTASTAIANALNTAQNNARVNNQSFNRDTNKNYSDWAAKGDYQNQIAAINAKVQDAKMIQPTSSGQIGGDAMMLTTIGWMLVAKIKTLDSATMRIIGEYWLRYGYAVHQFVKMPSNFQVMKKFTYWKLLETYITSSLCPESFKGTIRGIFEKGVTVWAKPEYIGNTDLADNDPISGVAL